MTTNPEIRRLEAEMEKIREQLLEVICSDEKLSKLERLTLIEAYELFKNASYIQHPMREKYIDQLKEAAIREGATYFIDDDWPHIENDYRERNEIISLPDELMSTSENIEDSSTEITILKDRGTGVEIKISYEQLESDVYDWCMKNKKIGYHFDW